MTLSAPPRTSHHGDTMRPASARLIEIDRPHSSKSEYRQRKFPNQLCEFIPSHFWRAGVAGRELNRAE